MSEEVDCSFVRKLLVKHSDDIKNEINSFTFSRFKMRGGRIGSGLGLVMESLWGFYSNQILNETNASLAWIPEHQFNDFACVKDYEEWDIATKKGEFFRIEVKSMVLGADESKAHFDSINSEIGSNDLLVVITWLWENLENNFVYPKVDEIGIFLSSSVAYLRDELHIKRGGYFINKNNCPDGCMPNLCTHHGEPINLNNVRERRTGPLSLKGKNVSCAQNFGGLVRMVATRTRNSKDHKFFLASQNQDIDTYIKFVDRLKVSRKSLNKNI